MAGSLPHHICPAHCSLFNPLHRRACVDRSADHGDPDFTEEFYKDYTREVKGFFTLRTMWWGYREWAGKRFVGTEDNWSFGLDMGDKRVAAVKPEELLSRHNGRKEQAAVTPAQHPSSLVGKSWTRETGEPQLNQYDLPVPTHVPWLGRTVDRPEGYGIYFQQRWDEAIQADPEFLYLNDWNEWTAGKYPPSGSPTTRFMRRDSTYFFVDRWISRTPPSAWTKLGLQWTPTSIRPDAGGCCCDP